MNEDRRQKPNLWDRKVTDEAEFNKFAENFIATEARFERPFHILLFFIGFCMGMAFLLWVM